MNIHNVVYFPCPLKKYEIQVSLCSLSYHIMYPTTLYLSLSLSLSPSPLCLSSLSLSLSLSLTLSLSLSLSPPPPSLSLSLPSLPLYQFLPLTVCDLIQYINSKLPGRSEHASLFIFIENEIVAPASATMAELYQEHREDDYFLYLAYYEENPYQDKSS